MLRAALDAFSPSVKGSPASHVHCLSVLLMQLIPHSQIVIAARRDDAEAMDAYKRICARFLPFSTVIYYDQSEAQDALMPEMKSYRSERPFAAYVCEDFTCGAPVYSTKELLIKLNLEKNGTV